MAKDTKDSSEQVEEILREVPLLGSAHVHSLLKRVSDAADPEAAAKAAAASPHLKGEELYQLVSLHNFGGLRDITSEDLQEEIGTRSWKKFCSTVLCDVKSYFTLEQGQKPEDACLVCHMPEYMVEVRFAQGKAGVPASRAFVTCTCEGMDLGAAKRTKAAKVSDAKDSKDAPKNDAAAAGKAAVVQAAIAELAALAGKDYKPTAAESEAGATAAGESDAAGSAAAKVRVPAFCGHQQMAELLYLLLTGQLQCDNALYQLFFKKEIYADFFAEVRSVLAMIGAQGLSNLNYDVLEMVKAAFVRASSFDIAFLERDLKSIYSLVKTGLETRQLVQASTMLTLSSKIYNTLEALDHLEERANLVKLYALNEDREYAVKELNLVGCGYNIVDMNVSDTVKIFYFYSIERQEFMAMRAISNGFFSSPTLLMETECSLYDAVLRAYRVQNAMISSGKLKNSKFSRPYEYDLTMTQRELLYNRIALPNFAALRTKAYSEAPRYFDPANYTGGLYLVKVSELKQIVAKQHEPFLKLVFSDVDGQLLVVRVANTSHYYAQFKQLNNYFQARIEAKDFLLEHKDFLREHMGAFKEHKKLEPLLIKLETEAAAAAAADAAAAASTEAATEASEAEATSDGDAAKSSKSKEKAAKAKKLKLTNKLLAQVKKSYELLQLEPEGGFMDYILVDCPLRSGRIRPVLASLVKLTEPDRKADQKLHERVRSFHWTIKTYKGRSEHGPLKSFLDKLPASTRA